MRTVIRHSVSALCIAMIAMPAQAYIVQAGPIVFRTAFQDSKKGKSDLYDTFKKGITGDVNARRVAYDAGKEFLQRYPDEKDPRTQEIKDWVARYDADLRGVDVLINVYKEKKYAEAFQLGKQVLLTDPDNIKILIALGYAGMPAASTGNNDLTADAIIYAKKSIQLIDSGRAPTDWRPFTGKDETLGWLNYSLGVMVLKTMPSDAIAFLGKAAMYEGAPKQDPRVYYYLAALYSLDFEKQRYEYKSTYEGKTETAESKAVLAKVNAVVDLIIDAYARAIAYTDANPQLKQTFQQQESEWTNKLTELYKSRHDGSADGLKDFIVDIRKKPLPGH